MSASRAAATWAQVAINQASAVKGLIATGAQITVRSDCDGIEFGITGQWSTTIQLRDIVRALIRRMPPPPEAAVNALIRSAEASTPGGVSTWRSDIATVWGGSGIGAEIGPPRNVAPAEVLREVERLRRSTIHGCATGSRDLDRVESFVDDWSDGDPGLRPWAPSWAARMDQRASPPSASRTCRYVFPVAGVPTSEWLAAWVGAVAMASGPGSRLYESLRMKHQVVFTPNLSTTRRRGHGMHVLQLIVRPDTPVSLVREAVRQALPSNNALTQKEISRALALTRTMAIAELDTALGTCKAITTWRSNGGPPFRAAYDVPQRLADLAVDVVANVSRATFDDASMVELLEGERKT